MTRASPALAAHVRLSGLLMHDPSCPPRFGNRISSSEGQPPLSADAHGPGTLATQVVDYADGSSVVYYSATCVLLLLMPFAHKDCTLHQAECRLSSMLFSSLISASGYVHRLPLHCLT